MKKAHIIGLDLGGTNFKIALFDSSCRLIFKQVISTRRFIRKEKLIRAICDSVRQIAQANGLSKGDILGVGLGVPGPVDHRTGTVHFFPNLPWWKEVKLKTILQKKMGLPVFLDNDAKLMALAEYRFGEVRNLPNVLCLTLGTGVGGGLILNGRLFRGQDNAAGEIGHLPINVSGPSCNCKGRACLESYIGNSRILKEAKTAFGRDITLEELSALAKKKNRLAVAPTTTSKRTIFLYPLSILF